MKIIRIFIALFLTIALTLTNLSAVLAAPPVQPNVTSSVMDGSYKADQVIPVLVIFPFTVIVTGTPLLTLSTGSPATTNVSYSFGSGTDTLTFNYIVAAANNSADLDYASNHSLVLNAGSIKDAAANDVNFKLASPGAPGSLGYNKNIIVDTTGSVFSAVAPVTNAFINSVTTASDVSYTLSKAIASGSITMTQTSGTIDAGSPHICTLKGTALNSGAHNNLDLSDTTNSCTVVQSLVNGAVYTFAFNGIDAAGKAAATVTNTGVTFDTTAPVFSAVAPAANTFINSITTSSAVSYTLSEAIASGSITMTQTGGTADAGSPHVCTLKGTALSSGVHNSLDLSDTTNSCTVAQSLVIGAIYTFAFNATDLAGNAAATLANTNVTFEIANPVFSSVAPITGAYIHNITFSSDVSYTLSKAIARGSITMTQTGGTADPDSPHICTLIGTALSSGAHNNLDLSNTTNACTVAQLPLVNGAVYTFAFNGIDANGNVATLTSTGVTSDRTWPSLSWITPSCSVPPCYFNVSDQIIPLAVNASDNNGISKVVFRRWDPAPPDGTGLGWIVIGTVLDNPPYTPPYSIDFDARVLLAGWNEIKVKATDIAGNVTDSSIFLNYGSISFVWYIYLPLVLR